MNREVTFHKGLVNAWRENHELPTEEQEIFEADIVPSMLLMDELPVMLNELTGEDESMVVSGITAARFRDPIIVGETVTISGEIVEEDKRFTSVEFEARVEERDSLVANGVVNVVIN